MKRVLIGTILFFIALGGILAQQAFKLIPPDKSFEVSFPGEPKHEQYESDSGGIHVDSHAYSFETSAYKFILSFAHLTPVPADLRPTDALDSAIGGTVENVRGKLLNQRSMIVKGKPAKAVTISVGETTIIDGRFVYVKPRVYQLLVLHRKGAKPAFEQPFFDSFTVPN